MTDDPNVQLLARVAGALGALRERVVFLGGCATALLITDPGAPPVRATHDVDAIVAVVSQHEYREFGKALRSLGFEQTLEAGDPPFRWSLPGMKLDVMPTGGDILGFASRWYEAAMQEADVMELGGTGA